MNRNIEKYINNFIVIIIVFSYFEFFKFAIMSPILRQTIQFGVGLILIVLILIRIIYRSGNPIKMHFALPILLLIFGSIPSYFTANSFYNQTFISTLFGNRWIYFYLLYFYLHYYKISTKFILRLIVLTGLFVVFLYYLQFSLYPREILDIKMSDSRGTIRLLVAGMLCSQAAYFYFLNQFFVKHNPLNLFLALLTLSIFILQGTRQLIGAIAFLTIVNLIFSQRVKSKFAISFLMALAFIAVFFVFREIFMELNRLSSSQANEFSEGIRLRAARFFLTDFMSNDLSYIFGRGNPGPVSGYSQNLGVIAMRFGYQLSDIGIIGDYVKYGIIFLVGGIMMLLKVSFFKVSPAYKYFKYYIFMQCFTLFTGYGIFSGCDIVILMILYVFDVDRFQVLKEQQIPISDLTTSNDLNNNKLK